MATVIQFPLDRRFADHREYVLHAMTWYPVGASSTLFELRETIERIIAEDALQGEQTDRDELEQKFLDARTRARRRSAGLPVEHSSGGSAIEQAFIEFDVQDDVHPIFLDDCGEPVYADEVDCAIR